MTLALAMPMTLRTLPRTDRLRHATAKQRAWRAWSQQVLCGAHKYGQPFEFEGTAYRFGCESR